MTIIDHPSPNHSERKAGVRVMSWLRSLAQRRRSWPRPVRGAPCSVVAGESRPTYIPPEPMEHAAAQRAGAYRSDTRALRLADAMRGTASSPCDIDRRTLMCRVHNGDMRACLLAGGAA